MEMFIEHAVNGLPWTSGMRKRRRDSFHVASDVSLTIEFEIWHEYPSNTAWSEDTMKLRKNVCDTFAFNVLKDMLREDPLHRTVREWHRVL